MTKITSRELLKRLGISIRDNASCYMMAYDSKQPFVVRNPATNKLGFQKVDLDLGRTIKLFNAKKLPKITFDSAANAPQTALNVGHNLLALTFFNPNIIPILMADDLSGELLKEETIGEFATMQQTFAFKEFFGDVQPYTDKNTAPIADVNYDYISLDQFRFESSVEYGQMETEASTLAGLNLIADKQEALAYCFAQAHERYNLFGIAEMSTYGFLNFPFYPESLTATAATLKNGQTSSKWEDKYADPEIGADLIAKDVNKLFASIRERTKNLVNRNNNFVLVLSTKDATYLEAINPYGHSALDIISKTIPNLKVVPVHHLDDAQAGRKIYLYPTEIRGQDIGTFAYTEKFSIGKTIDLIKGQQQAARAGTWGCFIKHPMAVGTMVVS